MKVATPTPSPDDDTKSLIKSESQIILYEPQIDVQSLAAACNIDETELVRELKEVMRGCEADIKVYQTIDVIEKADVRIFKWRKKITILKDR